MKPRNTVSKFKLRHRSGWSEQSSYRDSSAQILWLCFKLYLHVKPKVSNANPYQNRYRGAGVGLVRADKWKNNFLSR